MVSGKLIEILCTKFKLCAVITIFRLRKSTTNLRIVTPFLNLFHVYPRVKLHVAIFIDNFISVRVVARYKRNVRGPLFASESYAQIKLYKLKF